jgi:hypothetical protein
MPPAPNQYASSLPAITAARAGTILIMVAGFSALLASLALSFLVRMRTDVEESLSVIGETQAHIMLMAACNYIQEASRLGWDVAPPQTAATPASSWSHREGFGWVDVRDGSLGPKDQSGIQVWSGSAGSCWMDLSIPVARRPSLRCPMYVMQRPPFAITGAVAPNAIDNSQVGGVPTNPLTFGMPYLRHPDPIPVASTRSEYILGDPTPNAQATNPCWFRIFRDGPSTFVVCCGCGGTQGFRDWQSDVLPNGGQALFANDAGFFNALLSDEIRLWYRVEWSASVASCDYQNIDNNFQPAPSDHYVWWPLNMSFNPTDQRSQPHNTNMVGTIRMVQRLMNPPTYW